MSELLFENRYQELKAQFLAWDAEHPEVWELFKRFTFQAIKRGFKNYGAQCIIDMIRWHTDKPDSQGQSTFKINNNYFPFYSRRFMYQFPEFEGFFRLRVQSSLHEPPTNLPPLTPEDFPYTNQSTDELKLDL